MCEMVCVCVAGVGWGWGVLMLRVHTDLKYFHGRSQISRFEVLAISSGVLQILHTSVCKFSTFSCCVTCIL